jgi:hypothetical protein
MKKKSHDKCFEKLQSVIGCACIGDMMSELADFKKRYDKDIEKSSARRRDSSSAVEAETSTTKRPLTLREKIENEFGEWLCRQGLSVSDDKCDVFIDKCMEIINEK